MTIIMIDSSKKKKKKKKILQRRRRRGAAERKGLGTALTTRAVRLGSTHISAPMPLVLLPIKRVFKDVLVHALH